MFRKLNTIIPHLSLSLLFFSCGKSSSTDSQFKNLNSIEEIFQTGDVENLVVKCRDKSYEYLHNSMSLLEACKDIGPGEIGILKYSYDSNHPKLIPFPKMWSKNFVLKCSSLRLLHYFYEDEIMELASQQKLKQLCEYKSVPYQNLYDSISEVQVGKSPATYNIFCRGTTYLKVAGPDIFKKCPPLDIVDEIKGTGSHFLLVKNNAQPIVLNYSDEFSKGLVESFDSIKHLFTPKLSIYAYPQKILSSYNAYAIFSKGSKKVISFGSKENGELFPAGVKEGIVDVVGVNKGFLGQNNEGDLIFWGHGSLDIPYISKSKKIKKLYSNGKSPGVLFADDSFMSWHLASSKNVQNELTNVAAIFPLFSSNNFLLGSENGFAALKKDNSLVVWGQFIDGAFPNERKIDLSTLYPYLKPDLTNVKKIVSTSQAFAILKYDGSVFTFGNLAYGGSGLADIQMRKVIGSGVSDIIANKAAFVAIKEDGSLHAWGSHREGGKLPTSFENIPVTKVAASYAKFAAISEKGQLLQWGNLPSNPHLPVALTQDNIGFVDVYASTWGFLAIKENDNASSGPKLTAISSGHNILSEPVDWDRYVTSTPDHCCKSITEVVANDAAFTIKNEHGEIFTVGKIMSGADTSKVDGLRRKK